jgi:hypothetical protein
MPIKFTTSTGWCVLMMAQAGLTLQQHTNPTPRLTGEYAEKLVQFQMHVSKLRNQHMYVGHIGKFRPNSSVFSHAAECNHGRKWHDNF